MYLPLYVLMCKKNDRDLVSHWLSTQAILNSCIYCFGKSFGLSQKRIVVESNEHNSRLWQGQQFQIACHNLTDFVKKLVSCISSFSRR